jgi:hypothetical protein
MPEAIVAMTHPLLPGEQAHLNRCYSVIIGSFFIPIVPAKSTAVNILKRPGMREAG